MRKETAPTKLPKQKGKPTKNQRNTYRNKRTSRGRDESTQTTGGSSIPEKYNDPMWYAKNEQILRDAASFSYNKPLGTAIPYPFAQTSYTAVDSALVVPGLMAHYYLPTIGNSIASDSPANLAANNIYSYVRYMNSGAKNYDQADIMLYLLAMDSVYMLWNWMKRVYGYMRTYSQQNWYLPKALAAADRVDFDDIMQNLADFRAFLNVAAAQISSFCVPAVMPFFIRHSWMCSNVYKDSDIAKAQLYMFVPIGFYQLEETTSKYGTSLIRATDNRNAGNPATWFKFADMKSMMNILLSKLAYSEDIGVMSGDILKAYGQDKLFKLTPVDPDYTVVPVYNEEVLNQMHNSDANDYGDYNSVMKITQDPSTGFLVWNPTVIINRNHITKNHLINMPWETVTPANTMVGTRLKVVLEPSSTPNQGYIKSCGTELIVGRVMFYLKDGIINPVMYTDNIAYLTVGSSNLVNELRALSMISQFDWHPLIELIYTDTSGNEQYLGKLGDISNYTIMSDENLEQLNLTAIMSEFNIPQLGSF